MSCKYNQCLAFLAPARCLLIHFPICFQSTRKLLKVKHTCMVTRCLASFLSMAPRGHVPFLSTEIGRRSLHTIDAIVPSSHQHCSPPDSAARPGELCWHWITSQLHRRAANQGAALLLQSFLNKTLLGSDLRQSAEHPAQQTPAPTSLPGGLHPTLCNPIAITQLCT